MITFDKLREQKLKEATLTIKYGYDEGDGPDNKKMVKYYNKKSGATIKLGKNETLIMQGTDEQIHKALQLHYSDDKKGLGDLEYHKKGKTSSPDHQKGQFTYKEGVEHIDEGSWHLPGDKKVAAAFKKAMSKPIKLGKDGDDAVEAIEPYIGDDSLFDDLYAAGKKKPNDDARKIVMKAMKRLNIDPKTFQWKGGKNESLEEAKFDSKLIKQAYGIANDKRYKGGNMTGAIKAIEKLAKGLSKHPDVQKVLKVTNELSQNGLMREGLWDNIRAKRAAGKPKAKPGDKGYPKTLDIEQVSNEDLVKEDMKAGKYKKGELIVSGKWPNPDKWVSEYVLPNVDKKGVRIYATGPSFKIEKL